MSGPALQAAFERLKAGDPAGAQAILRPLIEAQPRLGEAHRLLGMSWRLAAESEKAEAAFREAIKADNRNPLFHAEYAAFLEAEGRLRQAEREFRQALSLDAGFEPAAVGFARFLEDQGRWSEAAALLAPFARPERARGDLVVTYARNLKEAGDPAAAEEALRSLIARVPANATALADLAEVVWMRTGDADAALSPIKAAIAADPSDVRLRLTAAKAFNQLGRRQAALEILAPALASAPDNPALRFAKAQLSGSVADAEAALEAAPESPEAKRLMAQALIGAGEAGRAARLLEPVIEAAPYDQLALALAGTAWRLIGDSRAEALYDYERTVLVEELDTPKGWGSLDRYLADLERALTALHATAAHPFGQSVRGGSQVALRGRTKPPAVGAVAEALEGPVRRAIARLRANGHPLGERASEAFRYAGIWSVRLRSAGYHDDHIHSDGWLSSACYVSLPPLSGQEGWLKLGEPGIRTPSPLPPGHLVEPKPGRLVLFPSYMWHGTVPFSAESPRLTFAFDIVPA